MRTWGIGYDVMQQLKSDIIYVSMAGFGHTGRHHHYTMGYLRRRPSLAKHFFYCPTNLLPAGDGLTDDTGGMYGAMCVLTALHHRNATGQGQHVDLSQMTAGITLIGSAFLDHTVNGRAARREGYRRGIARRGPARPRSITTVAPPSRPITPTAPMAVDTTTGASSPAFPMRSGRHWSILWAVLDGRQMPSSESVGTPATSGRAGRGHRALDAHDRQIRADGEVPGRCACDAGAKPRTGSSATPNSKPRHVPRVGPSAAGTTQGPERPLQALENARSGAQTCAAHRPTHQRSHARATGLSLDDIKRDTPTAPWPKDMLLYPISRRRCDERCYRWAAAGRPPGPLTGLRVLELADEKASSAAS